MANVSRLTRQSQGFTAIFIVIFATLLLSIIAVGFIATMVREQSRSTDDELSESAYDSALAGIEDGKRVLAACDSGGSGSQACQAIANAQCDTVQASGVVGTIGTSEVQIQSDVGIDNQLNQAYTCVIIHPNTDSYLGYLQRADDAIMVSLRSTAAFDAVEVSWYSRDDVTTASGSLGSAPAPATLTSVDAWGGGSDYPPLLKAHFMQYDASAGITPSNFNDNGSAHTVYLYPMTVGGSLPSNTVDVASMDSRRSGSITPSPIICADAAPTIGYTCNARLTLPDMTNRVAYLRLTSFYGGAHYQLRLLDGTNTVQFAGVQPSIDSTGRANDVFRRVEARVETAASDFPYPRATVDITESFCKDFSVTDTAYIAGSCTP